MKQKPSQAWERDWIDCTESMRNLGLVHGLVFLRPSLLRAGGNWWHRRWSFNQQLKRMEPQAGAFAREKMRTRHSLILVTSCGCAISQLCSQPWPELRCDSVGEDELLMGSLRNILSFCQKWKAANLKLVAALGM